jgi:hypothetical protein
VLDKKIAEEELRSSEGEVEDEVSSFEEVKVQKLVKEGKIEVAENPRFMMEARRKEGGEGEAEVATGVDINVNTGGEEKILAVSSSSSPQERVGGSCRCCDPAAYGRAGTGTGGYGCVRCS